MNERTRLQRQSATSSTEPASSFIPSIQAFTAQTTPTAQTAPNSTHLQRQASPEQETPEHQAQALQQSPLNFDFSKISIQPKLTASHPTDPPVPEGDRATTPVMRSPEPENLTARSAGQGFWGHDFSRISILPKLNVSQPDDPAEQEADRVADQVMRMQVPESTGALAMRSLQSAVQRRCAVWEQEDEEVMRKAAATVIQRDEPSSLPSAPNYQLTPPSLLQPPDPTSRYGLGMDMHLQLDPQLQAMAMQHVQLQLNPVMIRPALSQINLGVMPIQGVGNPSTPNGTTPLPNPLLAPPQPPASPVVPAGAEPDAPSTATPGDLFRAIMAVPAIDGALTSLQTQVGDRITQDWRRLSTGEQIGVVSTTALIGAGALAGVLSDPAARRLALDQLNGQMIPVPGLNWLHLEINTGGDNLMLGMHVDVGRLLPPSLGFGSSSPTAIGSPPQPEPDVSGQRMIQRVDRSSEGMAQENIGQRIQSASGGGGKLDEGVQQHLEQHLGADLSDVRIHTDGEADRLSRSVNAIAFTTGQDVFFSSGSYNPSSAEGKHLIAHEVVHTVQQANGAVAGAPTAGGISISNPSDPFELEADQVADRVMSMPDASNQRHCQWGAGLDGKDLVQTKLSVQQTNANSLETGNVLQRWTNPVLSLKSDKELLDDALNHNDTVALKQVTDFSSISGDLNKVLQLIDLLNGEGSVWGRDARAMKLLWLSVGTSFKEVAGKDGGSRWKTSLSKVSSLGDDVPEAKLIKEQFAKDVKAVAKSYLQKNDKTVRDEMKRLGLSESETETAQPSTKEQADAMQNVQSLASAVADLQKARDSLSQIIVGRRNASPSNEQDELTCGIQHYNNQDGIDEDDQSKYEKSQKFYNEYGGGDDSIPALKHECKVSETFDPNKEPDYPLREGEKGQKWEDVNKIYQRLSNDIADIANQSPAVYALIGQGGRNPAAEAATANASPEKARSIISKAMREVLKNIKDTTPKIDSDDLDYRDLTPIHAQLFSGMKAESGTTWSDVVPHTIAKDIVKGHEATQALIKLGLQTLAAMAFLVAEVASAGTATFFIAAAVSVGAAGADVAISAEKYEDLAKASKTNVSDKTSIISQGQVDAAQLDLELAAVAALLIAAGLSGKAVESIKTLRESWLLKRTPQGLTKEQFAKFSSQVRQGASHLGDDIRVHGSRAAGTAKLTSDIDVAIRVPEDKFNALIKEKFGTPNPGSAKERTMLHAMETGKIQAGEAGLRSLRQSVAGELGMEVDISVVKIGGSFDQGPWTPLK